MLSLPLNFFICKTVATGPHAICAVSQFFSEFYSMICKVKTQYISHGLFSTLHIIDTIPVASDKNPIQPFSSKNEILFTHITEKEVASLTRTEVCT